jgi:4-hydroxy-L-threonine phosphate dehydrogenase PdxA
MTGWFGITLGDVTGIGPEAALKAVATESKRDKSKYLFIGPGKTLERLNSKFTRLPLKKFTGYGDNGKFFVVDPSHQKLPANLPCGSPLAAQAAIASLREGAKRCLRNELDAMITAPVNKEAIVRAGYKNFVGQTEFLSGLANARRTAMMLLGHDE